MDIPMDRAPDQVRYAAMRAVNSQHIAGRTAMVSRIAAEKAQHGGWHYTVTISTRSSRYGTPLRPETVELHSTEGPRPLTRGERFRRIEQLSARGSRSTAQRHDARRAAAMDLDYVRSRIAHHERMRSPSVMVDTTPRRQQPVRAARTGGLRRDYTPRNQTERQMLRAGLPLLRGRPAFTRDMSDPGNRARDGAVLYGSADGGPPPESLHAHTPEEWDALLRQVRATR